MIRKLGTSFARETAKEAAKPIEASVKATAAAGMTPDGKPWEPTKAGTPPLQHAADAVSAEAVGATVVVKVTGYHALHHRGIKGGAPQRQIIPIGNIPPGVLAAARNAAIRVYRRMVRQA